VKTVERRTFGVSPAKVWSALSDPLNMAAWNPKCVSCEALETSDGIPRFVATYEMSGRRREAFGEVLRSEEGRFIQFRYLYEESSRIGQVDEIFELNAKGSGVTEVTHIVDYGQSSLPLWVKLLIALLSRFGRAVGPGPLEGLAVLLGATEGIPAEG